MISAVFGTWQDQRRCGCGRTHMWERPLAELRALFASVPTRRYASTGTSYGPVSVCLSQVGVLSKRLNESDCFLVRVLPSTYLTLCYKTILIRPEIKLLPSGTLFQSCGLGKFHHGISIVKTFYQLSSRKVDARSVINCYWTIKYYLRKGVRY